MNLTRDPEITTWPKTHYVYVEAIGPFMQTAQKCWQDLHKAVEQISQSNKVIGFCALYNPEKQIYRAGVKTSEAAKNIPSGLSTVEFAGGKYAKFTLKGSYAQLPEACGIAFDAFAKSKLERRDDFCVENYVNDPKTTPEDQLVTEILIPTK